MTKHCYPWLCADCGSAINDRTNHICLNKIKRQTMIPHMLTVVDIVDDPDDEYDNKSTSYRVNVWFK